MMMRNFLAAALLPLILAAPCMAADAPNYDRVSLSASASGQVDNDTMVVVLSAQADGAEAARLAEEVNRKIQWGVDTLKQQPAFKLQTQSYTTQPVYNKNVITGWRVQQAIRVESQDIATLSDALGELQQQLALQSVSFTISPKARSAAENALISEALKAFGERATIISESLGKPKYRLISINVGTAGGMPVYRQSMRMEAMVASDTVGAAPAMEAGEAQLEVSVNGEIELSD